MKLKTGEYQFQFTTNGFSVSIKFLIKENGEISYDDDVSLSY